MVRVKRGNVARKARKKIFFLAKSFKQKHSKTFRVANQQVMKSLKYSYVGRKEKKQNFRKLWITRLNIASRQNGLKYSKLIQQFKISNLGFNRKVLSQMAIFDPLSFKKLISIFGLNQKLTS